jgi:NAD(P)-dependent dehydrogenase (short-subunit alcohol dehydrogenase family)
MEFTMAHLLKDEVAVVTGAGTGIGRATALAMAQEGATVVVSDVQSAAGEETVRLVSAAGGQAMFLQCDVTQEDDVRALITTTVRTYGRLDCACNNAGVLGQLANTVDCTQANWDKVIAVNLTGVWRCMKFEIAAMLNSGRGSIVNIASNVGLVGAEGLPAYCASKGGVVQLTRAAALEYVKRGIRINAVCPGLIETEMTRNMELAHPGAIETIIARDEPIGRIGKPQEVAAAVVWLCSGVASFVTGVAMPVDGGLVAR